MADFVEQGCYIEFRGRKFQAGGAYILGDRAMAYVDEKARKVTDWHGKVIGYIVDHVIGNRRWTKHQTYRMAYVRCRIDGGQWWGRYNFDGGNLVRLRRVKG